MLGVVAALLMAPVTARAMSFTVDASHEVVQGGSVDFNATLTLDANDPDPLDLLGVDITLSGLGLTLDDSPFFSGWPLQLDSANPGFSGPLFTVLADLTAVPPGPYVGSVRIRASDPANAAVDLYTDWQTFEVTVRGTPAIPEPATMGLMALGVAVFATRRKPAR